MNTPIETSATLVQRLVPTSLAQAALATALMSGVVLPSQQPQTLTIAAAIGVVFVPLCAPLRWPMTDRDQPGPGLATWVLVQGLATGALFALIAAALAQPINAGLISLIMIYTASATAWAALWPTWRIAFATAIALASAAPLWLGPVLTHSAVASGVANGVVAISPLSHFAAALNFDLLREPGFYMYGEIGTMHFDYPAPLTLAIAAIALGGTSVAACLLRARLGLQQMNPPSSS